MKIVSRLMIRRLSPGFYEMAGSSGATVKALAGKALYGAGSLAGAY